MSTVLYFADSPGEGVHRLGYDPLHFQKAYESIASFAKQPIPQLATKNAWKGEIKKDDVELIKAELEVDSKVAEELLRGAQGDLVSALLAGTEAQK